MTRIEKNELPHENSERSGSPLKIAAPEEKRKVLPETKEQDKIISRASGAPAATSQPTELPTAAFGGVNPFADLQLAGHFSAELPALAAPLDLSSDLSPEVQSLTHLAQLELSALSLSENEKFEALERSDKIRQGFMLTLDDSVETLSAAAKSDRQTVITWAQAFWRDAYEKSATALSTLSKQGLPNSAGIDINSFVQAVMRESYLMQCEVLKDYADKVKFHNALKKKIREKAQAAREIRANPAYGEGDNVPCDFKIWSPSQQCWVDFNSNGEEQAAAVAEPEQQTSAFNAVTADWSAFPAQLRSNFSRTPPVGENLKLAELADQLRWKLEFDASRRSLAANIPASVSVSFNDAPDYFIQAVERGAFGDNLGDHCPYLSAQTIETYLKVTIDLLQLGGIGKHKEHTVNMAKTVMHEILGNITFEQMHALKENGPNNGNLWAIASTYVPCEQWFNQGQANFDQLPPALKSSPFAGLSRIYSEAINGGDPINVSRAQNILYSRLWDLPPGQMQVLIQTAAASIPRPPCLDKILLACNPDSLFAGASPGQFAWMKELGAPLPQMWQQWDSAAQTQLQNGTALQSSALSQSQPSENSFAFDPTVGLAPKNEQVQKPYNKEMMDAYIKSLEEILNSVGDDAQLANVDLQNALQAQQQTLQMMSNTSKVLHDTAMSIIRKLGN